MMSVIVECSSVVEIETGVTRGVAAKASGDFCGRLRLFVVGAAVLAEQRHDKNTVAGAISARARRDGDECVDDVDMACDCGTVVRACREGGRDVVKGKRYHSPKQIFLCPAGFARRSTGQ